MDIFFRGSDRFVFEVDNMQVLECFFKFFQQVAGIVLAVVIDNNDFVGSGIGLYQRAWQVTDKFPGFIPGADNDAHRVLL